MNYDALNTFVTVVEEKNFTKAANKLLISQPSVSVHIKNLENEFETKLFHRSPRMLKITPSGEILYGRAKQMLQVYEQAKKDIFEHHNLIKGTLKIGASFTIGEYVIPPILSKLRNSYSQWDFEVIIGNTSEVSQLVKSFQVDIGLIEGQTDEKDLLICPFMDDELFIISSSSHPLAKKKRISLFDLQDQTWITREKGSGTREYLEHVIRSYGLRIKNLISISSNQGVKEAVINGIGISILSRCAIQRDIEYGSLSIIHHENEIFKRKFSYLCSLTEQKKRSVEIFIQSLNGV
jgi:LysR family transcriptional regulator, transcriptional activator of the cysJI operon